MNAQANAVTTADQLPQQKLAGELEILKPQLEKVLPAHVSPDKFMRVVMTAIAQSPDLRTADRSSLLTSCVKCATDGLLPDGREAALVIFVSKGVKKVQYMPMVAGILKKVRNSGELLSIGSNVVHEKDTFRYWIDDAGEHITFEPNMKEERGGFLCAYAIAKTKDGGVYVEVMSRSQIEQVKSVSKSGNNGPWGSWYGEMARKTVIRRLSKRLPMSTDLEGVIRRDDELYELSQERLATARSGNDAAKSILGLPILPDSDDAAAALDGEATEVIDKATGEVKVKCDGDHGGPPCGDPECWAIEPPREKGTPLPGFDEKKSVRLLRGAKTLAALDNALVGVKTLLHGAEMPLAISAAYDEMVAKFADEAGK